MTCLLFDYRYERYVELKVLYSSGHKKYDENIPYYLHNRPKIIVDDLLKKTAKVTPEMQSSVKPFPRIPRVLYEVLSSSMYSSEDTAYQVDLGDEEYYPSCTCLWYRRNRSLCKHFIAVIKSRYVTFDHSSPLYREHPLHVLDEELFGSPIEVDDLNGQTENPDEEVHIEEDKGQEEKVSQEACFEVLPRRMRYAKTKKLSLLANLKQLVELCHSIKYTNVVSIDSISVKINEAVALAKENLHNTHDLFIERTSEDSSCKLIWIGRAH